MWDLPGPGLEPMSPALADRFLTTAPPGKPWVTTSWKKASYLHMILFCLHSEGGKQWMNESVKHFLRPICCVLTPVLIKELGFWETHNILFSLLGSYFCSWPEYYLHCGARGRPLDCEEWHENSKKPVGGDVSKVWTQVRSEMGREEATPLMVFGNLSLRGKSSLGNSKLITYELFSGEIFLLPSVAHSPSTCKIHPFTSLWCCSSNRIKGKVFIMMYALPSGSCELVAWFEEHLVSCFKGLCFPLGLFFCTWLHGIFH